ENIQEQLNSFFKINVASQYLTKLLVVLLPIMVGGSIYKDYRFRIHSLLYSFPVDKVAYLIARFLASFSLVLGIAFMVLMAMFLVEFLPGTDPAVMGSTQIGAYMQTYLWYSIPNLFFIGAMVFCVVLWVRNIYAAFIVSILPFLIQIITENAFVGSPEMIALLDPFGQNSLAYYTANWSILERNQSVLPTSGWVLYNRLFWVGVGLAAIVFSISRFKLHQFPPVGLRIFSRKGSARKAELEQGNSEVDLADIRRVHTPSHYAATIWALSMQGVKYVVRSPIFLGVSSLAVLAILFAVSRVTQREDMVLIPLTKVILQIPSSFFSLICMLLVFIYSGLLIHRERDAGMYQLVDTTATPFWVLWISKFLSMAKVLLLLMLIFMLTGIGIQLSQSFYEVEIGLYLYHLLSFVWIPLMIWTIASFFIYTLTNHLYLGLFLLLFGWVGIGGLEQIGITTHLLRFNSPPLLSYSDLNGYGLTEKAFWMVQIYWLGFSALLLVAIHLLWPVGMAVPFFSRFKGMKNRLNLYVIATIFGALILVSVTGFVIYEEESEKLDLSASTREKLFTELQEEFLPYAHILPPKIRSLEVSIDLYPGDQSFMAAGHYTVENPWDHPIDTLMIKTGFDEITTFRFSTPMSLIKEDDYFQVSLLKLATPLQPGQQLRLDFQIQNKPNTLFQRNSNILGNGTFLKQDILPRFGYTFSEDSLVPEDSIAHKQSYHAMDADLVDISLSISTDSDQWVIAPGNLAKHWQESRRNHFQYKTPKPIKFSFGISSGEFHKTSKKLEGKQVEVYSHHRQNLEAIYQGVSHTFRYLEKYFGKYGYDTLRIVEFPDSEGTYATAFANNLHLSEIRFVSNPGTHNDKIDLAYYVSSHELIHHWWGSSFIPARAKGASMLTESITEYLSLKTYESYFGEKRAKDFLSLQHKRYWRGHNNESGIEPPLYLVESPQQYVSYGKGTVVLHTLSRLIGEETFNQILADFYESHTDLHPPYPTSLDFIHHLETSLPDSLIGYIHEQFMKVSYFENEITDASISPSHGGYDVKMSIKASKWELALSDKKKQPKTLELDDWIEVGFYDEQNQLLETRWVRLASNSTNASLSVTQKPANIQLDPHLLILEKDRDDNSWKLEEK
ncbi:MAG: M1 family aminopeptidase, partial [Bacteroidota bacterium]